MLRRAFTLIEIILTLSLAVVLMVLVGSTLQFYSNNMTVQDSEVRQVQLAASILQLISDDLRASVYGYSFDDSSLETFLSSSGGQAAAATGTEATADEAAAMGTDTTTPETDTTAEVTDLSTSMLALVKPGLMGNQTQMQFDVSRLPRVEQWTQVLSSTPGVMADVPSDMKTVTYYVQPPGTTGGVTDPLQSVLPQNSGLANAAAGGLVRRQLDRAATNFASTSGNLSGLLLSGELIASEVVSVGFEYFDGTVWQVSWNSDSAESMPLAVRITLTMSDPTAVAVDDVAAVTGEGVGTRVFKHVVMLPAAINPPSTESTTDTATDETTGTDSGATTGTNAGSTTGTGP